jgi:hypothetical protein
MGPGLRGCNPIDCGENSRGIYFDHANLWQHGTTVEMLSDPFSASCTKPVRQIYPVFSTPLALGQLGYILLRRDDEGVFADRCFDLDF